MNTFVPKKELIAALERAVPVASPRSPTPIFSCVLLDASASSLRVSATDLHLAIQCTAAAETEAPGKVAVAGKDLLDRVRMMPEGPVRLLAKDGALLVKATGVQRRFTLRTMPGEDFPAIPGLSAKSPRISMPSSTLGDLIARVEYAVSTDFTRPHLSSCKLEFERSLVRAVATDGHCMVVAESKASGITPMDVLVPLAGIKHIVHLCGTAEEIELAYGDSVLHLTTGACSFSVRAPDATFPPYRELIPKGQAERTVRASRAQLAEATRAALLSAEVDEGLRIMLDVDKGALRVSAKSGDKGETFDEVPAETYGKPIKIGANAKLLLDMLDALGGEDVSLEFGGEIDPIVARAEGITALVMPMRLP